LAHAGRLVAIGLVYFLAGRIGLQHFAVVHVSASLIWAPAGIGTAAFLLYGGRVWPAIFVGAFLVNLTTTGSVLT
jgi:integral membrane sensor domain MASE1